MRRGAAIGVLAVLVILLSSFVSGYYVKPTTSVTTTQTVYAVDPKLIQNSFYKYPEIKIQLNPYQCTDSDGGINPYVSGAVLRIARNPSQYCRGWAMQYDQMCPPDPALCEYSPASCAAILSYCASVTFPEECFGTTGVDTCVGSSTIKEYYCSGSDIQYRYMSCEHGCSRGACRLS